MKTNDKYILWGFLGICTLLLSFYLQDAQFFLFKYREQHQLFLLDWDSIKETLFSVGGLGRLISLFLVQFFSESYSGAIITACLSSLSAYFIWVSASKIAKRCHLFMLPICYLPSLLLIISFPDIAVCYDSLPVLCIVSILTYIGISICKWKRKATIPVAVFFIYTTYLCFYQANYFYEPLIEAPLTCVWPWVTFIGCLAVCYGGGYINETKGWKTYAAFVLIFLLVGGAFISMEKERNVPEYYQFRKLNCYVIDEEWDKIIDTCNNIQLNNILYQNCLNLALSHKGILLDYLFSYPQSNTQSLLCENQKVPDILQLHSYIYFQMRNVAAAQNMAFSTSVCNRRGSPSALQMLVKTNFALGADKVALKYVSQLEKTWKYKSWAKHYRALYNEGKLDTDNEISELKKSLTNQDHFVIANLITDLDLILESDPDNKAAFEYLVAYLLLSKDNMNIRHFVDKYTGTKVLEKVPEVLQEAIYSVAEQEPMYLKEHGVSDKVFDKYNDFYNKFIQSRNARRNPATDLMREYGRTYWYYLMFK